MKTSSEAYFPERALTECPGQVFGQAGGWVGEQMARAHSETRPKCLLRRKGSARRIGGGVAPLDSVYAAPFAGPTTQDELSHSAPAARRSPVFSACVRALATSSRLISPVALFFLDFLSTPPLYFITVQPLIKPVFQPLC